MGRQGTVVPSTRTQPDWSLGGRSLERAGEYFQFGDLERSLEEVERILSAADRGDALERGKALSLAAQIHARRGEQEKARTECEEALEILRTTGENQEVAVLQGLLGHVFAVSGDLKQARRYLEDSLATHRRLGGGSQVAQIHNMLSHVAFLTRNWSLALEHIQAGLDHARAENDERMVGVLNRNLGTVYLRKGEWGRARECLAQSVLVFEKLGNQLLLCQAYLSLGLLEVLNRNQDRAAGLLERALQIARSQDLLREKALALAYQGELALACCDWEAARSFLEGALENGEAVAAEGDLVGQACRDLGELYLILGDLGAAESNALRALGIAGKMNDPLEEAVARRILGLVAEQKGDFRAALSHLEAAQNLLEEIDEKYEQGRTLLELGRFLATAALRPGSHGSRARSVDGGGDLRGQAAQYLAQAREIFRKLDCRFWWAQVELREAEAAFQHRDADRAGRALAAAGALFRETADRAGLGQVRELHRRLADSLVREVLNGQYEQGLLEKTVEKAISSDTSSPDWGGLVRLLIQVLETKRGLLACADSQWKLLATQNLKEEEAAGILKAVEGLLERKVLRPRAPLVSLDPTLDDRFDPGAGNGVAEALRRMGSLALVPFGLDGTVEGVIYLDRGKGRPFSGEDLRLLLRLAHITGLLFFRAQQESLKRENLDLRLQVEEKSRFTNVLTQNRQMLEILRTAQKVADISIPVLLEGETGTGKEQLAKAIHYSSLRRGQRFVAINCAALPETLLESELFGHKKGAFTGADSDKKGLFEVADGGTFLLDEVGDLPPLIQLKLLRALEQKEILRLGETTPRHVDVRFISASNRDLKAEVEEGRFRQDLYYRLNSLRIKLPPLRDRREDIPLLADHFLHLFAAETRKTVRGISPEVLRVLMKYPWPGNVRELQNEVRRLVALCEDDAWVGVDQFSEALQASEETMEPENEAPSWSLGSRLGLLKQAEDSLDRRMIEQALLETEGNKSKAALVLGLSRQGLLKKMERLGIAESASM